jgi:protein gp37
LIRRGPLPPNWWIGTTITGDKGNYSAVVDLLRVPCTHRWISAEPLHCPANFALWLIGSHVDELGITVTNSPNFAGVVIGQDNRSGAPGTLGLGNVRQLVEDCKATGTPVFVKQLWIRGQLVRNPDHFPPDLRLRNLPWSMPEEHGLLCYGAATDDEGD